MTPDELDKEKLRLEEQRLELERARLILEQSFSKKYATPFFAILGALVAGIFALAQVMVASIQKDKEVVSAQIQKDREIDISRIQKDREIDMSRLDRERRWRLDIADFVFRNREVIFSNGRKEEQARIINVIAVTFPSDVTEVLFKNLKVAFPEQQKSLVEAAQRLVAKIDVASIYEHSRGTFEKKGDLWIENPPYASTLRLENYAETATIFI
jgi:hypothetical protein